MAALKVNILQVSERRKGDNYNTYDVEYSKDGVTYSATQFGKQPLPTGEGEYDIIKDGDLVKIKKVATEGGFKGSKWQPKTEEQLRLEERGKYPSFAVSYAKDVYQSGKCTGAEMAELAIKFHRWMVELSEGKVLEATTKETVKDLPKEKDDNLPF